MLRQGWLVMVVFLRLLVAGRILVGVRVVLSPPKERPVVMLEYKDKQVVLSEVCAE
jgi:hypothetical protein